MCNQVARELVNTVRTSVHKTQPSGQCDGRPRNKWSGGWAPEALDGDHALPPITRTEPQSIEITTWCPCPRECLPKVLRGKDPWTNESQREETGQQQPARPASHARCP